MVSSHLTANNKRRINRGNSSGTARNASGSGATFAIYLFLVGISIAVFGQTIRYGFVNFDDDLYVYNAPAIKAGLSLKGLTSAFSEPHASNWHPLTTLSHMLDCQLYGLNAGGHHATNLILHIIAVLLLFRVLQQMTGALWESAIVAALFAVHPLHVESVAWVSERKDVLSAVFFFLMLGAYTRYAHKASITRYLAVVVFFAAGLMSKPMLVSVPIVLLLLDYWPLCRFGGPSLSSDKSSHTGGHDQSLMSQRLFLEKIPLFVLSAGASVLTFTLQKRSVGAIPPLPFLWRVDNAFESYVIYLWKTLWPAHLAVFYPHPNDTLAIWQVILAIGILVAITAGALICRNKRPYLLVGWFWYLVMLVPVIGVIQVGEQGYADRYTYLPHIGLFILMVWFASDLIAASYVRSRVALTATALIVFGLLWVAFVQTSYWRNSQTLWSHALAVTRDNDVAHNNLGYLCVDRGEIDKAISHFEAASKIRSAKQNAHYDVGSAFVQMNLADALARKGDTGEAMIHYEKAIKLQPNYGEAYYNRGNVLFATGHIDEAITDWEKTIQIQPNDADAYTGLGNAALRKGLLRQAVADYQKALALAPEDPHACINIAWVLATAPDPSMRDGAGAVEFAQKAVAVSNTEDPKFLRALAAAYAEAGRFSEAIQTAQRAAAAANSHGNVELQHLLDGDVALYEIGLPLRQTSPGKLQ